MRKIVRNLSQRIGKSRKDCVTYRDFTLLVAAERIEQAIGEKNKKKAEKLVEEAKKDLAEWQSLKGHEDYLPRFVRE